jgi:exosortase
LEDVPAKSVHSHFRLSRVYTQTLTGLALAFFFILVFWPSVKSLGLKWLSMQEAYSHGFISLILAGWLVKRQLDKLPATTSPTWFHPVALLVTSALWAAAFFIHTEVLQQMILPVLAALLISTRFGKAGFLTIMPALAIVYFAIPFWDYLNASLQWLSVQVSSSVLKAIDIEVVINGFFVSLPNGVFEIAGGCSGLRYLLVSLTLTYLYSFLNLTQPRYALALISTGLLFALISNWVRVFIIIYLGYRSNMSDPLVAEHENFGWYLYAFTLIPLFIIAHYLELQDRRNRQSLRRQKSVVNTDATATPSVTRWMVTMASTLCIPLVTHLIVGLSQPRESFSNIDIPDTIGKWNRVFLLDNLYVAPYYKGFTQSLDSSYSRNTGEPLLSLNLRLYSRQFNGKELINNSNREFDSRIWHLKGNVKHQNAGYQFLELEHKDSLARHVLAYTYSIGDHLFSNKFDAKLGQLTALLSLQRLDGALVQASMPCNDSCSESADRLEAFFDDSLVSLTAALLKAYRESH